MSPRSRSIFLPALSFILMACWCQQARADLEIYLTETGNDEILMSFGGSGVISGAPSDSDDGELTFLNFSGIPFMGNGSLIMTLIGDITISGLNRLGDPYSIGYDRFVARNLSPNVTPGTIDVDLVSTSGGSAFALGIWDTATYAGSGSAVVQGANFSDLSSGTYTSTQFDSPLFGQVVIEVVGVPEPVTCLLFGTAMAMLNVRRR